MTYGSILWARDPSLGYGLILWAIGLSYEIWTDPIGYGPILSALSYPMAYGSILWARDPSYRNVSHYCPSCNHFIGKYRRTCSKKVVRNVVLFAVFFMIGYTAAWILLD
uniref:Uncharacterized protein n=1 Tax=Acrobeloides nanus TaxID=290746 RepID=A0A914E0Z9_9BILA